MSRKNLSSASKNKTQRPNREPIPWRYCLLTLVCGLILVVGFFFAARQHFSSIDISIKNSRLRKQIEELEAGKRRLILAKEIALSPAEIKKAAQKIGFREMTASNIEVFRPNGNAADKPAANTADKPKVEKTIEEKPKQPNPPAAADVKKPEKEIKVEKKPAADKEKVEKSKPQLAKK
jgi:hypothetical protein